jgi:hypothetical protein
MRLHASYLSADVFFQIIEGIEMGGFAGDGACLLRQPRPQFVFLHLQQAAVSVVDDDEFLCVEQMVRDDQGPQRVLGRDPPGVADHVGVAGMQSQSVLEQDAGIHAGQDGYVTLGADGEISQREIAGEGFIGS